MKLVRFAAAQARGFRRAARWAPAGAVAFALAMTLASGANAASDAAPVATSADPLAELGPLPDIVQGSPAAAVTIVEYASMTCSHCAAFHNETWPSLKAKYVDSGKVKFILREFPLDPLATAGFMLARCAGPDKRNAYIDEMFIQQQTWAFVENPAESLLALVKTQGMSQPEFETCLNDQKLYDQVNQSRDRAAEKLNIDSTPTFFVNGRKLDGEHSLAEFDKVLQPLLLK